MKRLLIAFILLGLLFSLGWKMFMRLPKSQFLSQFSLEKAVKNIEVKGINCSRDVMGSGGGGGGGTRNSEGSDFHARSEIGCKIDKSSGEEFDEAAFIRSLEAEVRKEIEAGGASIEDNGSIGPASFFLMYKEEPVQGKISITGSMRQGYYHLASEVEERTRK
jgi:hypothetical protein